MFHRMRHTAGFNPLPAVRPGDAVAAFLFFTSIGVSIRSRRLGREMLNLPP